jgi:nucleotide-binding universal stress UspA family protein
MVVRKYQKILVPLDGSKLAEKALPYAQSFTVKFGSEIILLSVRLPAEDPYHPALKSYLGKIAETMKQYIHTFIKNDRQVQIDTVTVSDSYLVRHPAESIVNYATSENVDLIVMASHGHSGIKHWALGGVSDKVLHTSNIPVLLIRANSNNYDAFNNILAPLDGSGLAECILPHVREIALGYNSSSIIFLRVVEPFFHPIPGESDDGGHVFTEEKVKDIEYRNRGSAEKYLGEVMKRLGLKRTTVRSEVLAGNVAETIIEYAKNNDINLIVISTHGHSGMSQWTLGNITERVLHYSDLPVLVVRGHKIT